MFTYVTAIAIAATLTVCPMIVSRISTPAQEKAPKPAWIEYRAQTADINIVDIISLAGQGATYFLSIAEQKALKRALLRSVRIVSPSR